MKLVDAHCHLDLMQDPQACADAAEAAGIFTVSVTNAPSVFPYTQGLCTGLRFVRPGLGLHPELVASHGGELKLFVEQLPEARFVGEIGLDFVTTDSALRALQRDIFKKILSACADAGDKVITIHSRRATTAVLDDVGTGFPGKVILHWFSGTKRELQRAVDAGCLFSVNTAMLTSKSGQALIAAIPRERMLTETDGPFIASGDEPATPMTVRNCIVRLAKFWSVAEEVACETVAQNLSRTLKEVAKC